MAHSGAAHSLVVSGVRASARRTQQPLLEVLRVVALVDHLVLARGAHLRRDRTQRTRGLADEPD